MALKEYLQKLPDKPGVYFFKDQNKNVLYVGKALRLKDRVRSYFAKEIGRGPGIEQMVEQATEISFEVTENELEALLLEAKLIRQLKPRYNIRLRDDKSFALIRIDHTSDFPAVYLGREKELEEILARQKKGINSERAATLVQRIQKQEFFGPYLSSSAVKLSLRGVRKIWPFRDCSNTKYNTFAKLGHGCLFFTLGLCEAPCVGGISPKEYQKNIDQLRSFLRGERQKVLVDLQVQMEEAAEGEQFELAAKYRDRLQALMHLQSTAEARGKKVVEKRIYNPQTDLKIEAYDISHNQGEFTVGSLVVGVIQGGKTKPIASKENLKEAFFLDKSQYKKFKIAGITSSSDVEALEQILRRRLNRRKEEAWSLPDFIFLDGGKAQLSMGIKLRKELDLEEEFALGTVAKGPTRKRVDLYGFDWSRLPFLGRVVWTPIAEMLREEAHRFAISFYRRNHRKALTKA